MSELYNSQNTAQNAYRRVNPAMYGLQHRGTRASRDLVASLFTLDDAAYGALLDWEISQDLLIIPGDPILIQSKDGGDLVTLHVPSAEDLARQPVCACRSALPSRDQVYQTLLSASGFASYSRTPRTLAVVQALGRLVDNTLDGIETLSPLPCRTATLAFALATFLREIHGATLSHAAEAANDDAFLNRKLDDAAHKLCAHEATLATASGAILGRRLAQYLMMRMGLNPAVASLDHFSAHSWVRSFHATSERASRQASFVPLIVVPASDTLAKFWRGCANELRSLAPTSQEARA